MKAKIAAAVIAVFAAFGLGAGLANAAEAVVTEPVTDGVITSVPQKIDAALHSIDLTKDTTPAEDSPLKDIVQFLEDGINLAGRDVLTGTVYAEDVPSGDTPSDVDNPEPPFKLPTYDDPGEKNIETEPEFEIFTVLGNAVDRVVAAIPGVNKIRETDAWNSDYFRVFGALAVITTLLLPVTIPLGIAGGIGVSALLGTLVFVGAVLVGALGGVPVGIIPGVVFGLIGAILLPIVILATPLWLIAGIILVGVGAATIAGVVTAPAGAVLLGVGIVFVLFGLMPWLPIGIALGFLFLGFASFWVPIFIGAALMVPVGIVLGLAVFFLSMLITVPLGAGIAIGIPLLSAFLAIVLWLNNEPSRKKEDKASEEAPADTSATALMSTRDDVEPAPNKNFLNKLGDVADWFWDDLQWLAGKIVFIGPSIQRGINAMRHSKLWKSDPFRIATVISFITIAIIAPLSGVLIFGGAVVAGLAAFAIAAVVMALPLAGVGILLTGLLILVAALVPAGLVGGGIFVMIMGLSLMGVGIAGFVNPITVPAALSAEAVGFFLILAGLIMIGLGFFPIVWIPFLGLALLVGGLVTAVLFILGLILVAPEAAFVGAIVFVVLAPLAILVPLAIVAFGLVVLAIGLIFGLALPTRPAGEPLPKITQEDDPEYQHKDDWRYGRTDNKNWDKPAAEKEAPAAETTPEEKAPAAKNGTKKANKEGTRADYGLAA